MNGETAAGRRAAIDGALDAALAEAQEAGMAGLASPPDGIDYARVGDVIEVDVSLFDDGVEYSDRVRLGTVIAAWTRGQARQRLRDRDDDWRRAAARADQARSGRGRAGCRGPEGGRRPRRLAGLA